MAVVRLANIYNPFTFARRTQEEQTRLNRFIRSGIVTPDALLQAQIAQGGNIGELTHFRALATAEPNYSNDDPDQHSVPKNIATNKQRFRGAQRNDSWSTMDLARELALADPVGAITGSLGFFWATDDEKRILNSLKGIMADNVANDASDMVVDVSNDSALVDGAVPDENKISGDGVIDAGQTLGDHSFAVTTIAMHSKPFSKLQKDKLIEYVQTEDQDLRIPTYLGKNVIVDDSLPTTVGANRIKYTSVLMGGAIFASAKGKVLHPSAMTRIETAGNGSGQDIIHSRVHDFYHPLGWDFTSASVAGQSATYAELAAAANWNRVVDRKLLPLAFLITNG